ncbi:hypothetical protein HY570_02450 [Candidatus Micrarchaeota archaeon]|nr:hypothetical protein [Candidatus Micrarchaeota archaeon]
MSVAVAQELQRPPVTSLSHRNARAIIGILKRYPPMQRLPLLDAFDSIHALNEKLKTGITLVSATVADHILNSTPWFDAFLGHSPFPVDAIICYEKPGCRFQAEVVFTYESDPRKQCLFAAPDKRLILPVPDEYRGERNIALVITGLARANFTEVKHEILIEPNPQSILAVEDFPSVSDWYLPEEKTTVPHGRKTERSSRSRYLWRLEDSNYIGLIVRNGMGGHPQYFDTGCLEPERYMLVVEMSNNDFVNFATMKVPAYTLDK